MITVTIIENVLSRKWETTETDDLLRFLKDRFGTWPENARLYHENVAHSCDVTPYDEDGVKRLAGLDGHFYCVLLPKGTAAAVVVAIIIAVVAVAAAFLFKPKVPTAASNRNQQNVSPNNELSSRTNKARPNQRIPDIYGTVRSTPDLIVQPYSEYDANVEIEFSVMCIGRGQYEIHDMYDGETSCDQISGTSVEVYRPFKDINADTPYYRVGSPIDGAAKVAIRSNSINGQELLPTNAVTFDGSNNVVFSYPNKISLTNPESNAFVDRFNAGDTVVITGAVLWTGKTVTAANALLWCNRTTMRCGILVPAALNDTFATAQRLDVTNGNFTAKVELHEGESFYSTDISGTYTKIAQTLSGGYCQITLRDYSGSYPPATDPWALVFSLSNAEWTPKSLVCNLYDSEIYNLNGTYRIQDISNRSIYLEDPESVNPQWADLEALENQSTGPLSPRIRTTGENWIGWYILEDPDRTEVWANTIALNGLFTDDGSNQSGVDVTCLFQVEPIDRNNKPIGDVEEFRFTMRGSSIYRGTVALTCKMRTTFTGRCRVRGRRTSASPTVTGSVLDEVQWKDLYAMSDIADGNFGNVTLLKAKTRATAGALALKERKLNCLVTRQLPLRIKGDQFTTDLRSTRNMAEILASVSLDPYIGNRAKSELDFDDIYGTVAEAEAYFGTPLMTEFCYTLDSENLSYEETAAMIADVAFCTPYRMGDVIRLSFEKEEELSTLLFNHRNKLPGTEKRTVSFGYANDNDGVEFEWVSPEDDAVVAMYIPEDRSAVNAARVESVGVRNRVQAHIKACRAWNKQRYQSLSVEFDATQEAEVLIRGNRILVADNIRAGSIDGEVKEVDGLKVYAYQNLRMASDVPYTCFLQLRDGTTQAIPCTAAEEPNAFLLETPPYLPLVYGPEHPVNTTFIITESADADDGIAFLVTDKESQSNFTATVTAVNYDKRYYQNDKDFINGIITE